MVGHMKIWKRAYQLDTIKKVKAKMGVNEAKKLLIDIGRYNTSNKDENIKISYNT